MMEQSSGGTGNYSNAKRPPLGLWIHDPQRPRIFPILVDFSPSLVLDDNVDKDMTDIEDWASLCNASSEKLAFCGVCSLELNEHSNDGRMISCDGGYCSNSWYHFSCVGLAEAPTSRMIFFTSFLRLDI